MSKPTKKAEIAARITVGDGLRRTQSAIELAIWRRTHNQLEFMDAVRELRVTYHPAVLAVRRLGVKTW